MASRDLLGLYDIETFLTDPLHGCGKQWPPNTASDFLDPMLPSYVLVHKGLPQGLVLPQIIWFLKVKKRTRWLSKKTGHISDSNYIKMMTQFRKTQSVIKNV